MSSKQRPYILLELMIALGLTAILLSLLFRFFAGSVKLDQKISEARSALYQRQHFQTRISSLLNSIAPRSSIAPSPGSSFYTLNEKIPSLVAIFDNGIDPDPLFSGPILGKIYIDAGSNLTLALWPLEKTGKNLYRKEILLSGVENMRFQFLAKKIRSKAILKQSRSIPHWNGVPIGPKTVGISHRSSASSFYTKTRRFPSLSCFRSSNPLSLIMNRGAWDEYNEPGHGPASDLCLHVRPVAAQGYNEPARRKNLSGAYERIAKDSKFL